MTPLALHQITAPGTDPVGLVSIAQRAGCQRVCIFVNATLPGEDAATLPFPVVTRTGKRLLIDRLRDEGIGVSNVEFFPIAEQVDVEAYRAPLELAAELGARNAVTHLYDLDASRTGDKLTRLCEIAGTCGLHVAIEFAGLTVGCTSIQQAIDYVRRVGRHNLGVAIDALHLVRTGGRPEDVAALAPQHIAYAQLCDGRGTHRASDYLSEALNRLAPGDGDFPLVSLVRALPQTAALDLEVPLTELPLGTSALAHARRAVEGARRVLAAAGRF